MKCRDYVVLYGIIFGPFAFCRTCHCRFISQPLPDISYIIFLWKFHYFISTKLYHSPKEFKSIFYVFKISLHLFDQKYSRSCKVIEIIGFYFNISKCNLNNCEIIMKYEKKTLQYVFYYYKLFYIFLCIFIFYCGAQENKWLKHFVDPNKDYCIFSLCISSFYFLQINKSFGMLRI